VRSALWHIFLEPTPYPPSKTTRPVGPGVRPVPRIMEKPKRRQHPVDRMTEAEVRRLLKDIVGDVRAAVAHRSSADAGDFTIDRLEKAGVKVFR